MLIRQGPLFSRRVTHFGYARDKGGGQYAGWLFIHWYVPLFFAALCFGITGGNWPAALASGVLVYAAVFLDARRATAALARDLAAATRNQDKIVAA